MEEKNVQEKGTCIHKTVDATKWMRDSITEYITSKGFYIVTFDISCEIMTRFGQKAVINTMRLKFKDQQGNICSLDNYSSTNDDYDGENVDWLVSFIREKEKEALLHHNSAAAEKPAEEVSYRVEGEKKIGKLELKLCISSSIEDMTKFLTQKELIALWAGHSARFEGNTVMFENVVLKNIRAAGQSVEMEYKWEEWKDFSSVCIRLEQIGDTLCVTVLQSGVPVSLVDNVKSHWRTRVFQAISCVFRCAIKPTY